MPRMQCLRQTAAGVLEWLSRKSEEIFEFDTPISEMKVFQAREYKGLKGVAQHRESFPRARCRAHYCGVPVEVYCI